MPCACRRYGIKSTCAGGSPFHHVNRCAAPPATVHPWRVGKQPLSSGARVTPHSRAVLRCALSPKKQPPDSHASVWTPDVDLGKTRTIRGAVQPRYFWSLCKGQSRGTAFLGGEAPRSGKLRAARQIRMTRRGVTALGEYGGGDCVARGGGGRRLAVLAWWGASLSRLLRLPMREVRPLAGVTASRSGEASLASRDVSKTGGLSPGCCSRWPTPLFLGVLGTQPSLAQCIVLTGYPPG